MLISIETHITYDFPGGGGRDPLSPSMDPHIRFHNLFLLFQKKTLAVASQKIPLKKTIHLSTKTSDFIWPFLRPYMGVIPNPKMAFIFPILCT